MIIGMAGLAGVGKTTAIELLEGMGRGTRLYVGALVTEEVARLGLPQSPKNERTVRSGIRERDGPGALARRALPIAVELASSGTVLIDAIYSEDERKLYADRFGTEFLVLAIRAPLQARATRLATRKERSLSREQIEKRDEYELGALGLGRVLAGAEMAITNDGSLDEFERALQGLSFASR